MMSDWQTGFTGQLSLGNIMIRRQGELRGSETKTITWDRRSGPIGHWTMDPSASFSHALALLAAKQPSPSTDTK
jgi:hypothetical protein